ncbi:MAG: TonB family protein [Paraglaciecola sp.]|jgi:TonB family protein
MKSYLPAEMTLLDFVREAKDLTAQEDLLTPIKYIKKHLPENSPKYDLLILLERRYDKIIEDQLKGILSYEKQNEELNKSRNNLLTFINGLKDKDFSEQAIAEEQTDMRIGKTMYRIPPKMQVNEEVECHVWIAFDLDTILKEVQQEAVDEARDIRISNVMGVELFCHGKGDAFEITTYNETEQIIEKGLSTEWIFYVKPLKEGKYPLILRIAVIETVDGEKVHKTKVLRELVQIIAEAPEVEPSGAATKEAEGLVFMAAEENKAVAAAGKPSGTLTSSTPKPSNWRKRIPAMGGIMAVFLGLVMAVNGGLFSDLFSGEKPDNDDIDKVTTPGESNDVPTPEPVETMENEVLIDTVAWWNYLKYLGDTTEIKQFLYEFEGSEFENEAFDRLDFLEDSLANLTVKKEGETKKDKPTSTKPIKGILKYRDKSKQKPKSSTPKTRTTTTTAEKIEPATKPKKEVVATFRNVARKPIHPKCKRKKPSKQNGCTEDRIRQQVEDYLGGIEGLEGQGVVFFVIDESGRVTNIKMLKSDNNQLTKEVITVVKKFPQFTPGQNQLEVPVKVAYNLPIKVVN